MREIGMVQMLPRNVNMPPIERRLITMVVKVPVHRGRIGVIVVIEGRYR